MGRGIDLRSRALVIIASNNHSHIYALCNCTPNHPGTPRMCRALLKNSRQLQAFCKMCSASFTNRVAEAEASNASSSFAFAATGFTSLALKKVGHTCCGGLQLGSVFSQSRFQRMRFAHANTMSPTTSSVCQCRVPAASLQLAIVTAASEYVSLNYSRGV